VTTSAAETFTASAPVCRREEELGNEEQGFGGRQPGAWDYIKFFQVIDHARDVAVTNNIASSQSGQVHNVRHAHQFSQVRFCISGAMNFGIDRFEAGDVQIIGDSVKYGPMQPAKQPSSEPLKFLQTQFTGPSGLPFIDKAMLQTTQDELSRRGVFDNGVYRPDGGNPLDSFEAIVLAIKLGTYELTGKERIEYAPSRTLHPIHIRTSELPWRDSAPGISVKHVAYLYETGPNIKLVRLAKGAQLPAGRARFQQTRWLYEGSAAWQGEHFDAVSVMFYPPDVDYPATEALEDDTKLMLIQWANAEGTEVPLLAL
jgi:hypothetical protein